MKYIKEKMLGRIMKTNGGNKGEITIFIPTIKAFANAKVLEVSNDWFNAHRLSNYNTHGDFRTELMNFDENFILNEQDYIIRSNIRIENGLSPLE